MNFKKLTPELVEGLNEAGLSENPKEIQSNSIPVIKSGSDLYMIAPKGAGKSIALVMGVIQQLKKEFEEAPRAIIMTPTKEEAFELEKRFELVGRYTSLRTFTVFEQGDMKYQKDFIFDGIDILIGTPIRMTELLKKNGIPFSSVKMIVLDNAQDLKIDKYVHIYGVVDKAPKSQVIIAADTWNKNFDKFSQEIMKSPRVIKA